MPLQIRRGTTAQRLSITPAIGELLYDVSSKQVFVGDGITPGGIGIDQDSSPNVSFAELNDTLLEDVVTNDTVKFDGSQWINTPLTFENLPEIDINNPDINQVLKFDGEKWANAEILFNDLVSVDINNPEINQVLKFDGERWTNANEDSSTIVTSLDDLIDIDFDNVQPDQTLKFNGLFWTNVNFLVDDNGNIIDNEGNTIVNTQTQTFFGDILGNVRDPNDNIIVNTQTQTFFGDIFGSTRDPEDNVILDHVTGTLFGNVVGELTGSVISGDSSVLIDADTNEVRVNIGRIANTLIIGENSTRFQQSIFAGDNAPLARPAIVNDYRTSGPSDGLLFLNRASESDSSGLVIPGANSNIFSIVNQVWDGTKYITGGSLNFNIDGTPGEDDIGQRFSVRLFDESTVADQTRGIHYRASQRIGIMTDDPQETLDVRGNSLFSGYVQFGSFTTVERDNLTVSNGAVIYNTTSNRFQGYQNGAWINLDDGTSAA